MKYRIALGLDLSRWNSMKEHRLLADLLNVPEAESWSRTRATVVFYSRNPSRVLSLMSTDKLIEIEDFKWINVSKED